MSNLDQSRHRQRPWAILGLVFFVLLSSCTTTTNEETGPSTAAELPFGEATESSDSEPLDRESPDSEASATDAESSATEFGDAQPVSPLRQPSIKVVSPADGATVPETFDIAVEVENLNLVAAGQSVVGEGHWHVIVDKGCLASGEPVPQEDEYNVHVGDGATVKTVTLPPGEHELCVQFGDGFHVAVNITDTLTVVVE